MVEALHSDQPLLAKAYSAFLEACRLDVEVAKPGNVSAQSAGHGMVAAQFIASAKASAGPLFTSGASVGTRIFEAIRATRAAVDCNTNLGIVLLVAPLAAALDAFTAPPRASAWRAELERTLARLTVDDARAAYRAIALANPGGLGDAPEQSVHAEPTVDLRTAMALAAERDSIARQYANGFADIFERGLPAVLELPEQHRELAILEAFFTYLSGWPDSHIVRKHGEPLAQSVTLAARSQHVRWRNALTNDEPAAAVELDRWDSELKTRGLNPGTSADLAVATMFVALSAASP
ncbi:triphosphoribosyl-dephospho-CoA synthase [Trinickia sp. EG282A]|uniref:triphosphoribosyl-dephospho-CoA synthase n=1 Tax=Trinickia sp. EG282A TaxID=3237013 RepID=UPI0034D17CEC